MQYLGSRTIRRLFLTSARKGILGLCSSTYVGGEGHGRLVCIKYTWSIGNCATWCNIPAPSSCRSLVAFNSVAQVILRLCKANRVRLLPQFVPGCLNVLADSLSRGSQVLGSEWTLNMEVCLELFHRWPVTVNLFATSFNHRLQVYFSPMADP